MDEQGTQLIEDVKPSSGGIELAIISGVFCGLGLLLDNFLGTLPIFTVTLFLLGIVGASISMFYRYRHAMELQEREARWAKRS